MKPGKYEATVTGIAFTESKSGTQGIAITFESDMGENIVCTRWVTPNTRARVVKDLETLGFPEHLIEDQNEIENMDKRVVGNRALIVVDEEEYKGQVRSIVKWINDIKPVNRAQNTMKLFESLTGKTAAPTRTTTVESFSDDVPF
jgi:F0F1-type ATP synthase alpha subunit